MALQSSEVTMGEGSQQTINNSSLKKLCYLLRNEGKQLTCLFFFYSYGVVPLQKKNVYSK